MKLSEYLELVENGVEVNVYDKDYDIEVYFYSDSVDCTNLAKKLKITKIAQHGVTVNLSNVIQKAFPKLKEAELFRDYDIDVIMDDIENILAGNVSDEWYQKFVECL